jgi:hypothetical protein
MAGKELPLRLHIFMLLVSFTFGRLALLHEVRNITLSTLAYALQRNQKGSETHGEPEKVFQG